MKKYFEFDKLGTNYRKEILGGLTTFLSMAYILAVNPGMLSDAGMPFDSVFVATAIAAAIGSLFMGVIAKYPIALCTSITLEAVLKRDGVVYNADEVHVQVVASKEEGIKNRFSHFQVDLTLPSGVDEEYKKKLLKVVERGCTISNTVSNGATVTLNAKNI